MSDKCERGGYLSGFANNFCDRKRRKAKGNRNKNSKRINRFNNRKAKRRIKSIEKETRLQLPPTSIGSFLK